MSLALAFALRSHPIRRTPAAPAPVAEPAELELVSPELRDMSEADFQRYILAAKNAVDAGKDVPARATIHAEVKVVDEKKGLIDYIASDETLDSYREAISAAGWRFNRFKKNAPFVDSHNYYTIANQLGKVVDFRVEGRSLVERVQWAIEPEIGNELAQFGFKMASAGYLKAVSVGFLPVKMATRWDGNETAWQAAVAALKLSAADAAIVRAIYLEHEQIELSACLIGANGNAVARSFYAGVLNNEELDKIADFGEKTLSRVEAQQKAGHPSKAPEDASPLHRERGAFIRELNESVATLRRLTNR